MSTLDGKANFDIGEISCHLIKSQKSPKTTPEINLDNISTKSLIKSESHDFKILAYASELHVNWTPRPIAGISTHKIITKPTVALFANHTSLVK